MPFRRHLHYAYMGSHFIFKTGKHLDCQKKLKNHMQACSIVKKRGFFCWSQLISWLTGSYLWQWHPRKKFATKISYFLPIALYYTRCANPKVVECSFSHFFFGGERDEEWRHTRWSKKEEKRILPSTFWDFSFFLGNISEYIFFSPIPIWKESKGLLLLISQAVSS